MSRLNLLVIQDVPPKKKDGWFNTVGLEAYNALQLFMHFWGKAADLCSNITLALSLRFTLMQIRKLCIVFLVQIRKVSVRNNKHEQNIVS